MEVVLIKSLVLLYFLLIAIFAVLAYRGHLGLFKQYYDKLRGWQVIIPVAESSVYRPLKKFTLKQWRNKNYRKQLDNADLFSYASILWSKYAYIQYLLYQSKKLPTRAELGLSEEHYQMFSRLVNLSSFIDLANDHNNAISRIYNRVNKTIKIGILTFSLLWLTGFVLALFLSNQWLLVALAIFMTLILIFVVFKTEDQTIAILEPLVGPLGNSNENAGAYLIEEIATDQLSPELKSILSQIIKLSHPLINGHEWKFEYTQALSAWKQKFRNLLQLMFAVDVKNGNTSFSEQVSGLLNQKLANDKTLAELSLFINEVYDSAYIVYLSDEENNSPKTKAVRKHIMSTLHLLDKITTDVLIDSLDICLDVKNAENRKKMINGNLDEMDYDLKSEYFAKLHEQQKARDADEPAK